MKERYKRETGVDEEYMKRWINGKEKRDREKGGGTEGRHHS